MRYRWLIICIVSIISCCKDDKKDDKIFNNLGEIISLPALWRIPINDDGNVNYNPSLENNMVFDGKVIIPTTESGKARSLTMIDSKDGSILWKWNDWFQPETEGGDFTWNVRHNNNLHWTTGSRRYTINTLTGENIFRHRNLNLFSFSARISNDSDKIYFTSEIKTSDGYIVWPIFSSSIYNSEIQEILRLPFSKDTVGVENRTKSPDWVIPFSIGDKKYLFIVSAQTYPEWYYDQRINLYNVTDSMWVYRDRLAAQPKQNNGGWSKYHDGNFYFTAGKEMFCYEILSGKQLWKREFPHDFTFSGFEISDNIMVANCENESTYGINISNGAILWETAGSGTSSKLNNRIMNGVVYFSGGGPLGIFAKDIVTGKTLWKLDASLYEKETGGAFWRKEVNVIPAQNGEKAKIVVCSERFAYCFEAVK